MCWLVSREAGKQAVCTVQMACFPAYAVIYGLAPMKMGIMMPETY